MVAKKIHADDSKHFQPAHLAKPIEVDAGDRRCNFEIELADTARGSVEQLESCASRSSGARRDVRDVSEMWPESLIEDRELRAGVEDESVSLALEGHRER